MKRQPRRTNVIEGSIRLARGDAAGLALFGHTPRDFLASLIPPMILPTLAALSTLADGDIERTLTDFLAAVATLLMAPVVTHVLARRWRREVYWLRYAIAFNWLQFSLSLAVLAALLALGGTIGDAPPTGELAIAIVLACLALIGYALWLHWFVARTGLAISASRAILVVIANYLGTATVLLVWGPPLMGQG